LVVAVQVKSSFPKEKASLTLATYQLSRSKPLIQSPSLLDANLPMKESRRQFRHIKTSRRLAVRLQVSLVRLVGYSRNSFMVKTS